MTRHDLTRLRAFAVGDCWTDGLFDQNHCARLEKEGYLKYKNASFNGRLYELTEAGKEMLTGYLGSRT